ncbi:hypothetical protein EJ110_NYTH08656 [Nymphaea thermarum]|nr:hypothetical protein EJ110_NYTH08656 [Nymphaea thermarum]
MRQINQQTQLLRHSIRVKIDESSRLSLEKQRLCPPTLCIVPILSDVYEETVSYDPQFESEHSTTVSRESRRRPPQRIPSGEDRRSGNAAVN